MKTNFEYNEILKKEIEELIDEKLKLDRVPANEIAGLVVGRLDRNKELNEN